MSTTPIPWTFTPFPALPPPLLPTTLFYKATNPALTNQTYQISISYPFEWFTTANTTDSPNPKPTLALYVLDGNALGLTAAEAVKRRRAIDAATPDTVVISIGYPLSDAVYDWTQRNLDFTPPLLPGGGGGDGDGDDVQSGQADAFLEFITGVGGLREWVRMGDVFPGGGGGGVEFGREGLYGHSMGGLFVVYALTEDPGLFDTYLAGSPAVVWNEGSILETVIRRFGDGMGEEGDWNGTTGPAVFIGYGEVEQFPVRRRSQTEEEYQAWKRYAQGFQITEYSYELSDRLKGSGRMRDVVLKEYAGQDHSAVGATALVDGIDFFLA